MHRSNVQLLYIKKKKEKKCFTTRGLFISVVPHVNLIAETRDIICQKT